MLGELVGDIVGFFKGLILSGSLAAWGVGRTIEGSLDNVFNLP